MSDAVPTETTWVTGASVACVSEAMIMLCPDDGEPFDWHASPAAGEQC